MMERMADCIALPILLNQQLLCSHHKLIAIPANARFHTEGDTHTHTHTHTLGSSTPPPPPPPPSSKNLPPPPKNYDVIITLNLVIFVR